MNNSDFEKELINRMNKNIYSNFNESSCGCNKCNGESFVNKNDEIPVELVGYYVDNNKCDCNLNCKPKEDCIYEMPELEDDDINVEIDMDALKEIFDAREKNTKSDDKELIVDIEDKSNDDWVICLNCEKFKTVEEFRVFLKNVINEALVPFFTKDIPLKNYDNSCYYDNFLLHECNSNVSDSCAVDVSASTLGETVKKEDFINIKASGDITNEDGETFYFKPDKIRNVNVDFGHFVSVKFRYYLGKDTKDEVKSFFNKFISNNISVGFFQLFTEDRNGDIDKFFLCKSFTNVKLSYVYDMVPYIEITMENK